MLSFIILSFTQKRTFIILSFTKTKKCYHSFFHSLLRNKKQEIPLRVWIPSFAKIGTHCFALPNYANGIKSHAN